MVENCPEMAARKSIKEFKMMVVEKWEEQVAEKKAKKAAKAAEAAKKAGKMETMPVSLQDLLAKTSAKKFEGGFQAGSASHVNQDIEAADFEAAAKAAALRGLTGNETEEEAMAMVVANMKEFITISLQTALAEHINGKVANGVVLPDNSNYLEEMKKSWREASEGFVKGGGEDLLKLFGSQEELASFMASMEAELGLDGREITHVVEVQGIDPTQPVAPSIRANDQVHEVPASMEGLQADVARLKEKFGK